MNSELQGTLYEKYPSLFENKNKTIRESCMAWGIETGDGWFNILNSLCYAISQHEKNILIKKENYELVKFDQIKEKFGGLRVYFSGGDEFVRGLVSMAEASSYFICETCGNKGSPNKQGWISTLCDICRKN